MGVCILSKQKLSGGAKESMWEALQETFSQKPTKVDAQNAERTLFYTDYLINILKGLFEVKCPEEWSIDFMLETLIRNGVFSIQDTTAGILPLNCQPFGVNVFYRPTNVNIANPIIGTFTKTIGVDCTLIYLFDDKIFRSFMPLVNVYAAKLAMCDSSIDVNLLNSKVAFIIDCADKKQADEAKLIYDKISRGEPAVFYTDDAMMSPGGKRLVLNKVDVKNSFVADLIQNEKRTIMNEFLTMIGVNNVATEKKERLVTDEANANNEELYVDMAYVYRNIKKQVKLANKMFPTINLDIKIKTQDNKDPEDAEGSSTVEPVEDKESDANESD